MQSENSSVAQSGVSRRRFLLAAGAAGAALLLSDGLFAADATAAGGNPPVPKDWLPRWQKSLAGELRNRSCDREMGEEIGWLVSPILNGCYYGYLATQDTQYLDHLIDWGDAVIKRGIKEPDGFIGWPKADGTSTDVVPGLFTDNMLGNAMFLRPLVQAANQILKTPQLQAKYEAKAKAYNDLSEQIYQKWDTRSCWRPVAIGGVWVVPEFGIDQRTHQWTAGYANRQTTGFTLPDNKQNLIAQWLIAMHEATDKPIYLERARLWWEQMKSRMHLREGGQYYVWNYWEPAGAWDYKPGGRATRHWVGVHPNGGYYASDVDGIATAFDHKVVFTRTEIDHLIATNRDFMWNKQIAGAKFIGIDGGKPTAAHNSPGMLWSALAPYDATLRKIFLANFDPAGWGGLAETPRFLARDRGVM